MLINMSIVFYTHGLFADVSPHRDISPERRERLHSGFNLHPFLDQSVHHIEPINRRVEIKERNQNPVKLLFVDQFRFAGIKFDKLKRMPACKYSGK